MRPLRLFCLLLWLSVSALLLCALPTHAAERGFSNYVPGTYGDFALAVAQKPGVYVRNNVFSYAADREQIVGQDKVHVKVDAIVDYATITYVTDIRILGARYAALIGLPVVQSTVTTRQTNAGTPVSSTDDRFAIGDFFFTPVSLLWRADKFHFNLYEYIVAPTGKFDEPRSANSGFGYWSFQTNFATTYLNEERGHEASILIGFVYNAKNHETNYKTGQEFFLEYMLNKYIRPSIAIGVHGYFYNQITGDSGKGAVFGPFKSESAAIGPAVLWNTSSKHGDLTFIAKWLHEYNAVNRFKGDFVTGSFVLKF